MVAAGLRRLRSVVGRPAGRPRRRVPSPQSDVDNLPLVIVGLLGSAGTLGLSTKIQAESWPPPSKELKPYQPSSSSLLLQQAIERIQNLKIDYVCVDFDQTLIGVHTGGVWRQKPADLLPHIRPVMRHLLQHLVASEIPVAIVTFSSQEHLIREILVDIVGRDKAQAIPVRTGSPLKNASLSERGDGISGLPIGKQAHIRSLTESQNVLLIDDDMQNIYIAMKSGLRTVWIDTNNFDEEELLRDIAGL